MNINFRNLNAIKLSEKDLVEYENKNGIQFHPKDRETILKSSVYKTALQIAIKWNSFSRIPVGVENLLSKED
ncbi:LIMLP_19325 family protein [Leptospira stimsonii]|uniref:LIMLP_19325 family protein n=1 Tax=Leptospira stimsonii TaxID=2202203 RepID=UPI0011C3A840|nr:hypothetical protein [Leptospira stimsonii]